MMMMMLLWWYRRRVVVLALVTNASRRADAQLLCCRVAAGSSVSTAYRPAKEIRDASIVLGAADTRTRERKRETTR